jgi:hypothetical protein
VRGEIEGFLEGLQEFQQDFRQRSLDRLRGVELVAFGAHLQVVEQVLGGIEADVAAQQQGFQIFEQFVVDLAAREKRLQLAAKLRPRACEAGLESLAPRYGGCIDRDFGVRRCDWCGLLAGGFFRKPNMGLPCLKGARLRRQW